MENKVTCKSTAISIIKEELSKNNIVTRSDIIKLYMKFFNIHKMHGGVHANVDLAIRELKNEKYIKVIGRGIYSKI